MPAKRSATASATDSTASKTFTGINQTHRIINHAGAKRIILGVDAFRTDVTHKNNA